MWRLPWQLSVAALSTRWSLAHSAWAVNPEASHVHTRITVCNLSKTLTTNQEKRSTGDCVCFQAYHRPCPPRSWLWWWGSACPDGPRQAATGWRWSSPPPHTGSRRWSSRGMPFPARPCRSGGCCRAPPGERCSLSRTGRWWELSPRRNLGGGRKKTAGQLKYTALTSDFVKLCYMKGIKHQSCQCDH